MAVTINGSGQIITQVIQTVKTDTFSSTTSSYVDVTGLSVSITPKSASNKIFIFANVCADADTNAFLQFSRNGTAVGVGALNGSRVQCTSAGLRGVAGEETLTVPMMFMDSPATTSSVTYTIQGKCYNSSTFYVNRSNTGPNVNYEPSPISTITVMEVAYA